MSLQQNLSVLPAPLQAQIGAYLHKQIPAYCTIESRYLDAPHINVPIEKMDENVYVRYKIWRGGEVKFHYDVCGANLLRMHIDYLDSFMKADTTSDVRLNLRYHRDHREFTIFSLTLQANKPNIITFWGYNGDTSEYKFKFKRHLYKKAFEVMLQDMDARINQLCDNFLKENS